MSEQIPLKPVTDTPSLWQMMSKNAAGLGLFAVITVGLIAGTWTFTAPKIRKQVRLFEERALVEILPQTFEVPLLDATIELPPSKKLGNMESAQAFAGLVNNRVQAVILPAMAPDGYNGKITLLVGINRDGSIAGVRTITHKETPGLGDKINTNVSPWIYSFNGTSLANPNMEGWAVKKDGGEFDQFTGATITPRAVVGAVHRALLYFEQNRGRLLNPKNVSVNEHE